MKIFNPFICTGILLVSFISCSNLAELPLSGKYPKMFFGGTTEIYLTELTTEWGWPVKTGNIQYKSTAVPTDNYLFYKNSKLSVERGGQFVIRMKVHWDSGITRAWIDWNGDKIFQNSELVAKFGEPNAFGNYEGSIYKPGTDYNIGNVAADSIRTPVPKDAKLGVVRMRVITAESGKKAPIVSSGKTWNASVVDFNVEIRK